MACVLVVDDNREACAALSRFIQILGYESVAAFSGEEALAALVDPKNKSTDLIILDNMMPGMDGIEVLRRVREEMKLTMPIVMFSAISDPVFREHAKQKGATDYWVKAEFEFARLGDMLKMLLGCG